MIGRPISIWKEFLEEEVVQERSKVRILLWNVCIHVCCVRTFAFSQASYILVGHLNFTTVCPIFLRKPLECLQPQPMVEECTVCATKFRHSCSGAYALAENGREVLSITVTCKASSVHKCLPDLSSFDVCQHIQCACLHVVGRVGCASCFA